MKYSIIILCLYLLPALVHAKFYILTGSKPGSCSAADIRKIQSICGTLAHALTDIKKDSDDLAMAEDYLDKEIMNTFLWKVTPDQLGDMLQQHVEPVIHILSSMQTARPVKKLPTTVLMRGVIITITCSPNPNSLAFTLSSEGRRSILNFDRSFSKTLNDDVRAYHNAKASRDRQALPKAVSPGAQAIYSYGPPPTTGPSFTDYPTPVSDEALLYSIILETPAFGLEPVLRPSGKKPEDLAAEPADLQDASLYPVLLVVSEAYPRTFTEWFAEPSPTVIHHPAMETRLSNTVSHPPHGKKGIVKNRKRRLNDSSSYCMYRAVFRLLYPSYRKVDINPL